MLQLVFGEDGNRTFLRVLYRRHFTPNFKSIKATSSSAVACVSTLTTSRFFAFDLCGPKIDKGYTVSIPGLMIGRSLVVDVQVEDVIVIVVVVMAETTTIVII